MREQIAVDSIYFDFVFRLKFQRNGVALAVEIKRMSAQPVRGAIWHNYQPQRKLVSCR